MLLEKQQPVVQRIAFSPIISHQEIKEFLKAIAFGGDEILIRMIAAKDFGVKEAEASDKYRHLVEEWEGKKKVKTYQGRLSLRDFSYQPCRSTSKGLIDWGRRVGDGIEYLQTISDIHGTFFLVNKGSNFKNADVLEPRAIMYEMDNCSIDEQWTALRQLENKLGTKVSRVVETGKSLHCYFQLVKSESIADWKKKQERLNDYMNADRTIKNPGRVMRLPGFPHRSYNKETGEITNKMVRVVENNDTVYSLKDFDWLPESDRERRDRERTERIDRERKGEIERAGAEGRACDFSAYDQERATIKEIRRAVDFLPVRIPGAGTYGLCRDALWGLCDAVGIEEAARLYEMHSPSGGDWDVRKIAGSFRPGDISSGTFWWMAKQGGYRAPIRQRVMEEVRTDLVKKAEKVKQLTRIQVADGETGVYEKALSYGKKFIIDMRLTGAGKTHQIAEINEPLLYCCPTPYNPATPYLFTLPKMPARHSGRYEHPNKLNAVGQPLTEAKDNGGIFKPGNCLNAEEANLASSAGVEMKICSECPVKMKCLTGESVIEGGEPGYLWQMAKAKTEQQLRLHPQSLPRIKETEDISFYDGKVLVFDDISITAPTTKKVGHRHVLKLNKVIQESNVNDKLKSFFNRLAELSSIAKRPENKWGLSASECQPEHRLHEIGDRSELEILQGIEDNQIQVNYPAMGDSLVEGNGIKSADVKAFEAARNEERRLAVIHAYRHEGIGAIVNPLIYHPTAIISFDAAGDLLISWHDDTIKNAIASSKTVWISDATGSIEDITVHFGIKEDQLLVIESAPRDNTNLEIVEATGFGSLTKYSTPAQVNDVVGVVAARATILGAGAVGLIANYESLGDDSMSSLSNLGVILGKPHSDSRGSNAFSGCREIFAGTSFVQNKGSLANEYALIYGELVHPSNITNPKWLAFCWRKQAAEVIQFCGRARHSRRRGEDIRLTLLGQLPETVLGIVAEALPGARIHHEFRVDYDGITFRELELKQLAVFDAVHHCRLSGEEQLSWQKLEKISGINKETIRSIFTFSGKMEPSERRKQLFDQIDSGECYLPSQKLQMVVPETFDKRNKHRIDKVATPAEIEAIVDARVAYIEQVKSNTELAEELLPVVDPEYWDDIFDEYQFLASQVIKSHTDPPN
jgi:hypothetical protein